MRNCRGANTQYNWPTRHLLGSISCALRPEGSASGSTRTRLRSSTFPPQHRGVAGSTPQRSRPRWRGRPSSPVSPSSGLEFPWTPSSALRPKQPRGRRRQHRWWGWSSAYPIRGSGAFPPRPAPRSSTRSSPLPFCMAWSNSIPAQPGPRLTAA